MDSDGPPSPDPDAAADVDVNNNPIGVSSTSLFSFDSPPRPAQFPSWSNINNISRNNTFAATPNTVLPSMSIFGNAHPWNLLTATSPRLVRIREGVESLAAYRSSDDDDGEAFEWPKTTHSSPQGAVEYAIGFHPITGQRSTGVVQRALAPNLFSVSFHSKDLYLHAEEFEEDVSAKAVVEAKAVKLREGVRPAFGMGMLRPDDVVGVLRYDSRTHPSPVLNDGTVALMCAKDPRNLTMLIEELEPAEVTLPWPTTLGVGDAVAVRSDVRRIGGDVAAISQWERAGVIVGSRNGTLVVNFPEASMRSGMDAQCLEVVWRPPVGTKVRVCVERPAAQITRHGTLWAHDPSEVGTVLAMSHDGVVYCRFEGATPKTQVYFLHELEEVDEDADAAEGRADRSAAVVCPLTLEAFREPVCAEDGESYERAAWEKLCARPPQGPFVRSPCTRAMITTRAFPNRALRRMVEAEAERQRAEEEREGEEEEEEEGGEEEGQGEGGGGA